MNSIIIVIVIVIVLIIAIIIVIIMLLYSNEPWQLCAPHANEEDGRLSPRPAGALQRRQQLPKPIIHFMNRSVR